MSTYVTIRNNGGVATLRFCVAGGKFARLKLIGGVNLNIPSDLIPWAKKHPVIKADFDRGRYEVLTKAKAPTLDTALEKDGFKVVDDPQTEEPLPLNPTDTQVADIPEPNFEAQANTKSSTTKKATRRRKPKATPVAIAE